MLGRVYRTAILASGILVGWMARAHADTTDTADTAPLALSIEQALEAAVPASDTMAAAEADVARSEASLGSARAGWLPQVNSSASYTRTLKTEYSGFSFGSDLPFGQANVWRVGLSVSQLLFDGGRTSAGIRTTKIGIALAKITLQSQRAVAVVTVAQSYYDAALAQRRVEIAQASLDQAEQTLTSAQLGFKQGATPEFDVLRAEVARDNQVATLIQYKSQRDVAMVSLARLVGVPVNKPLVLTSKLEVEDVEAQVKLARAAAQVEGDAPAVGTDGNLQIQSAKGAVELSQAQVDTARAGWWPQVAASTDFGLVNYPSEIYPSSDWRTNWTVGVGASFPIFDGFRRGASIKAAKAERAAAQARLRETSKVASVSYAQADSAVAAAAATSQQSARTVAQAQRAYEIAELRYKQGSSTHLELVDARVQLEQALLHQAQSSRDLRVAMLRRSLLDQLPLASGF